MISKIRGVLVEKLSQSFVVEAGGLGYEVYLPAAVVKEWGGLAVGEPIELEIYHYVATDPSRSIPVLIGFKNKLQREFFEKFITVSGIGPKAALRALTVSFTEIADAIDTGDRSFLTTLPGVGDQRAREIVAKLQGKMARFGLMKDGEGASGLSAAKKEAWTEESLTILTQLQYRREEAKKMIQDAVKANPKLKSTEELLNEVYRQKSQTVPAVSR